ncbi:MAG: ParB N-terminal domain-containing protein [Rhizobiaceae bacterium]|nr:ParB N-terminal domain-containing protein [Rhizobiaceae bacterium]
MTDYTTPETDITKGLEILRRETLQEAATAPGDLEALAPGDIKRMVAVFQPRSLEGRLAEDDQHVATLVDAIGNAKSPRFLDPILVWWSGVHWYVVDGFHRLLAYRKAGVNQPVPVAVFSGSLEEAVEAAAAANSKDKLPMTKKDKNNMAWRLTLFFEGRSKRQVARSCAVSERNVANMRKARRELLERGEKLENIPEEWDDARRFWQGIDFPENHDFDAARQRKVERMAKALSRALGRTAYRDPDVFAAALKFNEARLPRWLLESHEWADDVADFLQARADLEEDENGDY